MLNKRLALLLLLLVTSSVQAAERLTIAVASNFHSTADEIAASFSAATDISVRISSGSTGSLYARIVNGAPYDIFLAADTERPKLLVAEKLAVDGSLFVYASGRLVLWSTDPRYRSRDCLADLANGQFSRLAIANPGTAPYGLAAQRFLEEQGIWEAVIGKLVYGENVTQAFQFVATGNANLGLIAASLLVADEPPGTCKMHVTAGESEILIPQAGVVLQASKHKNAARQFLRYMKSAQVTELLERRGYEITTHADSSAGPGL